MTARSEVRSWWSCHAFLSDVSASEDLLVQWVAPRTRDLADRQTLRRWFFVRYWEGGPHLRLRFQGLPDPERRTLLAELRTEVLNRRAERPAGREEYYANHPLDGIAIDPATLPWFDDGTVVEQAYEPETARYGGRDAIEASEELFATSSSLAIALVAATRDDFARRSGVASALMIATACAVRGDRGAIAPFLENHAAMWTEYSDRTRAIALEPVPRASPDRMASTRNQIEGRTSSKGPAAVWRGAAERLVARLRALGRSGRLTSPTNGRIADDGEAVQAAIAAVLRSQLHMLANRLGVGPAQEMMLARLAASAARGVDAAAEERS